MCTSSVQFSVQEGQPSGDTVSHPAACRPVHCVDRQVASQTALTERQTEGNTVSQYIWSMEGADTDV